jgi:hypothetical protein
MKRPGANPLSGMILFSLLRRLLRSIEFKLTNSPYRPKEFVKQPIATANANSDSDSEEESRVGKMPSSDEDSDA